VVLGYGIYDAGHAKLDVFPEFAPPMVVIQTEAAGLSSEQVEQLVTRPIENGLNGVPSLTALRSQSIQGLSAITAVFAEKSDIFRVRQMVSERLVEVASQLPQGVEAPKMGPLTSSTALMLAVGLTSTNRTPMELRSFADWMVRPRLLAVPGVAKVEAFGGEVRQIQAQVRPERLQAFGLGMEDVLAAARKSTGVRGAGFLENRNQRIVICTEGQALTPEELGQIVVAQRNGISVRLKDVADVVDGAEPKVGDAQIMGQRGVILLTSSQFGANTMEVTHLLENALEEMKPLFASEKVSVQPRLFRPASFIEASLKNINHSLLFGGVLVVAVLFLFLLDLRTAFISFVSIPLSLCAAVIVLDFYGASLNTITLGGFAIAIGVVVDDAIIDVENILRRLRENQTRARPDSLFNVILQASLEVRSAIVYATFIVALVFVPVLMMTGVQGKLFSPLAIAFLLATLASLVVALTATPALCYLMLSRIEPHSEPRYVVWLKKQHRHWLETLGKFPKTVVVVVMLMCLGALAMIPFFGGEFLPEFREGHFIVHMMLLPGASIEESLAVGQNVTRELLKNPHIRTVAQQVGRAEQGEDTWGSYMSEFHVELAALSGDEAEAVEGEIREALAKFPGASFKVMPFLAERMEEVISGSTAQVVITLFGEDLDLLDGKAAEIQRVIQKIPGAVDVQTESQHGAPELFVRLRQERLLQLGFQPMTVLETVETAYRGTVVAQNFYGNRFTDVAVILNEENRKDPESVGNLMMRNAEGVTVPLRELAELYLTTGRDSVVHEATQRRQQVVCNVEGRDIQSFVKEAKNKVGKISFPRGTYVTFGGMAEAQTVANRELILHASVAAVGIVLFLSLIFAHWQNLVLVLANLPFALVGGVIAVFASGGLLSVGSLVGFVTLFGITMRNSIMLISHFDHLVRVEGKPWNLETALQGATERLVPILMTALVTALGLLPLAIGGSQAGHEIESPMALVILGGLITSTMLNLLVLPSMALKFGRFSISQINRTNHE
jgi:CzcA family heavy metal efflux pump